MCRIKQYRCPLGRNCGMYRMDMVFCSGWRESVPCPSVAHGFPFPGDSISFRLPRQPAGAALGMPGGAPAGWPVLSLNNRKHPAKRSRPGCFLSGVPAMSSSSKKQKNALQSTFIVKRSTLSKMYVSLSFPF